VGKKLVKGLALKKEAKKYTEKPIKAGYPRHEGQREKTTNLLGRR